MTHVQSKLKYMHMIALHVGMQEFLKKLVHHKPITRNAAFIVGYDRKMDDLYKEFMK